MSEIEKIAAVQDKSNLLSSFIDWLGEKGYTICKWQNTITHSNEIGDYTPEGYYPKQQSHEWLLADYFEIDLQKAEAERVAFLENIRKRQRNEQEEEKETA